MATELRPFQKEGVLAIYHFNGCVILADEQGLGKTIQSLSWITKIPKRRPVVIVTPSSVKYAWQAEADLHFKMRTVVLEGNGPKRKDMILRDDVIILNYDILKAWLPVLQRRQPEVVIFDECHYVKNPRAARTRAAKKLAENASSRLALSGTPMTNKPIELWSILNIVRPDLFPNFFGYARRYCKPILTHWGWQFPGAIRKKELFQILKKECMIRRLKKDVAPELPDKIHQVIPFRMDPKAAKEYHRASEDFITWLTEKSPAKANRAKRSASLAKVGYLFRLCAELKLPMLLELLKDFREENPDTKIVGLTMHTFVIDRLRRVFPKASIVNGQVTGWKRREAVRRFTSRKDVNELWGNWKAAGAGLNLQVSSNFFSLDLPWTPGDLLQGQDRVHRIGQTKKVIIRYPILLGTIEEKWMKILRERTQVLKAILDGKGALDDEDLFDTLLKEMKK